MKNITATIERIETELAAIKQQIAANSRKPRKSNGRGRRRLFDEAQCIDLAECYYNTGHTLSTIARRNNCSPATISNSISRVEIPEA